MGSEHVTDKWPENGVFTAFGVLQEIITGQTESKQLKNPGTMRFPGLFYVQIF